jgi:pimeloyl-ACP methyl ester carboxylesterase
LVFDAVHGITRVVENLHANIVATPRTLLGGQESPPPAPGTITSSTYALIREITRGLRHTADAVYYLLPEPEVASGDEGRIKTVAALNGAFGDHLEATNNPLATEMTLVSRGLPLEADRDSLFNALPAASPHLVILVHGLGLSEMSWMPHGKPGIRERMEQDLGSTALPLRYNSGRHISTNGKDLARLLERVCASWPVPVESISLVGHSMGGLLIRSACWYGEQQQASWLGRLKRVVCLGTPHHGSPLEKAGHWLDRVMQKTPYTEPLAIGRRRSAGIKDLRHGNLLDEDWQGQNPDMTGRDNRHSVPLPTGVDFYLIAATVGRDRQDPIGYLLGDLLVRLDSALGAHADDLRRVNITPEHCRVFYEGNHFDLLNDERVHRQIVTWFAQQQVSERAN